MEARTEALGEFLGPRRAWRACEWDGVDDVATRLSPEERADLEAVGDTLPADVSAWLDLPLEAMSTPRLHARFEELTDELAYGRGFILLRGIEHEDPERLRRMFWVVGNHLGEPVMQNARGEVLAEVYDRFAGAPRGMDSRGYESNDELNFHCDGGDCIGLGCVRPSPSGGESGLVSLLAIYNALLENHPEHLEVLYRGFPLYVRKETEADGKSTREAVVSNRNLPVFAQRDGYVTAWLNRILAEHAATASGVPLSREAVEALDCLEAIANHPDFHLRFALGAGDVVFIHNLSVMHRRDRYTDHPDPGKQRRFYRMWTNLRGAHEIVPEHAALRAGVPGPRPVIVGPR